MVTPRRSGQRSWWPCFICGAATGQVPTAPPPHPALDEVVKEYRRLGLPLPPRGAKLVRINWYDRVYYGTANDKPTDTPLLPCPPRCVRPAGWLPRYLG
jgi:hypothetical protein